jgi:putative spermidine/putrescine transport system substrate-binding protein
VARFPGKRGLPRQARGTLEIALMADGVGIADVYRVLGSAGGVARAFRKLDQLRPYVAWWTDGDAARRALTSRAVMMTLAPAAFDEPAPARGGPIVAQQWSQSLTELLSWTMPRRGSDAAEEEALSFLEVEQEPLFQAAVTRLTPVLGAAPGAMAVLAADLLADTQAAPGRAKATLRIDDAFWRDHTDLSARFDTWLTSPPG